MANQFKASVLLILVCLFCMAYGAKVFSDEDIPARVNSTDKQCRNLAELTKELDAKEKQEKIKALIECLKYEYFYTLHRGAAKYTLMQMGEAALPGLIEALNDQDHRIAEGAAITLGMIGLKAKEAAPAMKDLLRSKLAPEALRKYEVASALGKIGEIDFLIKALKGEEPGVSVFLAGHGIMGAGPNAARAIPVLLSLLNEDSASEQYIAADALGAVGELSSAAIPRLKELTRSKHNFVRRSAGEALLKIGTPDALEAAKNYKMRKGLWEGFFKTMSVFVWSPWLVFGVAVVLGAVTYLSTRIVNRSKMTKSLYIPAALWLLYAVWEFYAKQQGANIRIDLLLIYPVLLATTIIGFVLWFIGLRKGACTTMKQG